MLLILQNTCVKVVLHTAKYMISFYFCSTFKDQGKKARYEVYMYGQDYWDTDEHHIKNMEVLMLTTI